MYYCIVNPASKSGRKKEIWETLSAGFKERGIDYRVVFTKGPGHARRIVARLCSQQEKNAADPLKIVVVGGDGTFNEALNGVDDFDRVLFGAVSAGSANDLMRGMKAPSPEEVMERIFTGKEVRRLDVGCLVYHARGEASSRLHDETVDDKRYFAVSSGIGFDAAVCEEALSSGAKSVLNRIGLGKLTYLAIAVKELLRAPRPAGTISYDEGEEIPLERTLFAAAMNLPYEGGGFKFTPKASATDGYFDVMDVTKVGALKMFFALPFSYFGRHYWVNGVRGTQAKSVRIKTDEPLWVHTDGEVQLRATDVEMRCLHGCLRFMI